jgi:hypothetical protein
MDESVTGSVNFFSESVVFRLSELGWLDHIDAGSILTP